MNISLKVENLAEVRARINDMGSQAKKARKLWINWTGIEMQGAMREQLPQNFHMRGTTEQFRRAVVFRQAKDELLDPRLVRQSAELVIGNNAVGGTKASATQNLGVILARHEEADTRTSNAIFRAGKVSFQGGFFIPAEGMRTNTTNPPRSLYPTSIGAQIRIDPGGKLYFAKSKRETTKTKRGESFYVIANVGIFRRRASMFGASDGEPIWWFNKSISTPARLQLWVTAQRVFDARAAALGMQAIEEVTFRATL